ncbi:MAG: ATP-binding protein [Nitrospirota bacterium]|nr:ATP-binding protein [Nitrospirota bacterium]
MRVSHAKLRHNACIEDIDYRAARGLEKTVIRGLAKDSQWVQNQENLFILGPTDPATFCTPSLHHWKHCPETV